MVSVVVVVTVPQVYANVQTQDADLKCERVSEHQLQLDKAKKCHNPNKYDVSFDWGVCVCACVIGASGGKPVFRIQAILSRLLIWKEKQHGGRLSEEILN